MYDFGIDELRALEVLFKKKKLYRYNSEYNSECDLFEKEFSHQFQINHSLILSSGTNALIASLLSVGIKPGDEVIVPVYTFFATINAVLAVGAIPIIVQNNSELGYDLEELNSKISEKTKAIILVHMDGLVSNVVEVQKVCLQKSIFLIEDCAQALGAELNGKKIGTFGQVGCFSLNENKILSCGEGGILITNDRQLYEKSFCAHDTPSQFSPSRKDFYKCVKPFVGLSMRVSEIHGTIMRVQLKKLTHILKKLRQHKRIYRDQLSSFMISGYSTDGDCGTTVHLKFESVQKAAATALLLTNQKIPVMPLIKRPAHVAWKWHHLINQSIGFERYSLLDFTESVELLSPILRIEVDINQDEATTKENAIRIKKILTGQL